MGILDIIGQAPNVVMAGEAPGVSSFSLISIVIVAVLIGGICLALSTRIAVRLVRWRAERLTESLSERLLEEWLGEIAELSHARQLRFALGVAFTRRRTFERAFAGEEQVDADGAATLAGALRVPADLWPRVIASFIDVGVVIFISWLLTPLATATALPFPYTHLHRLAFGLALSLLLNVWCVVRYGGSPGKLIMKLRIVAVDAVPLHARHALLRVALFLALDCSNMLISTLALVSSGLTQAEYAALSPAQQGNLVSGSGNAALALVALPLFLVDMFMTYHDSDHRSLRDRIAGTMVVYAEPRPINSTETLQLRG